MRVTNEEIIKAYQETGSVWRAGKKLGMAGQTVHEKLKALGIKLQNSQWTEEELEELRQLANQLTIAQIANRLGRPYNGVAIKISRLGLGERFGNKGSKKIPRTGEYNKDKIKSYIAEMDSGNIKITKFAKQNSLKVESLVRAAQRYFPEWYEAYAEKNAAKPKAKCPYCELEFWPQSAKQIYCNRQCANSARTDFSYFGGNRRNTIGLAEGVCQLCGNHTTKGLSSHHMIGKENDPENKYLIALCQGCHHIVTIVSGRKFAATPEAWEVLIQLVLIRKHGHDKKMMGVNVEVDIDFITEDNIDFWTEE